MEKGWRDRDRQRDRHTLRHRQNFVEMVEGETQRKAERKLGGGGGGAEGLGKRDKTENEMPL